MKQKFINITDFLTIVCGIVFTVILIFIINFKDYTEVIKIHVDTLVLHSPIASWHAPTIAALFMVGIIGYIVLRLKKTALPPLQLVIMFSFMIIGTFISSLCLIQLSNNVFNLLVFYLSLFPLNFIICSITLMKSILKDYVLDISAAQSQYKNKLLYFSYSLLIKSKSWVGIAIALTLPVLIILMLILILFGQQPDAIIKAFTETSDWVLSKKISPPPVEVDAHYLCTVSLRGHEKLVKPLRYGVRRNTKIVVNRQLLVANAFEQLIEEKVPRTHKLIRYIYDKYGYPLSRHINTTWSADIIYILMKPLEWIFLVVLYALDNKPETRIAKQYLP
ncbi:hypothetical protein GOM49_11300 [Clostridium bovifaecis]|uniref:Uncharacterized protein n=1 Tax=Clostridium bovifaecis TaxID=2184719 RepID=A0A6I6ESW9_9CLOT|nr:hypothetical protein GOM49_11300 [Clostridium bovifaecis]